MKQTTQAKFASFSTDHSLFSYNSPSVNWSRTISHYCFAFYRWIHLLYAYSQCLVNSLIQFKLFTNAHVNYIHTYKLHTAKILLTSVYYFTHIYTVSFQIFLANKRHNHFCAAAQLLWNMLTAVFWAIFSPGFQIKILHTFLLSSSLIWSH
jgi:hypothetical protein